MLLVQLIGFIAVMGAFLMFLANNRHSMLRIHVFSSLLWALHYALLGAPTGAAVNLLRAGRDYAFDRFRRYKWMYPVSLGALVLVAILSWHNWTSIFPIIATIIGTTALWQKSSRKIRYFSLFVPPFWFAYNVTNGSIAGMVNDLIIFSSVVVGIYRFDIHPRIRRQKPVLQEVEVTSRDDG